MSLAIVSVSIPNQSNLPTVDYATVRAKPGIYRPADRADTDPTRLVTLEHHSGSEQNMTLYVYGFHGCREPRIEPACHESWDDDMFIRMDETLAVIITGRIGTKA